MDIDSKVIDARSIVFESPNLKEGHGPASIDQNTCNNFAPCNDGTDHEDKSLHNKATQKDNNHENIDSHTTSMSSITISSGSRPSETTIIHYENDIPLKFSQQMLVEEHKRHALSKVTEESTTGVETSDDNTLHKVLSFRTDSTGSLGSLMSNVDISASDTERNGTGSNTPESSNNSTPTKKHLHNVSNTSLLVSALKHNHRLKKKSVSFSLPSPDDIARRVQRKSSLIYQEVADFDDNIPDYQVSPKNTTRDLSRKPRSFSHDETESGKQSHINPAQSTSGIAVGGVDSKKASFSGSPMKVKRPVNANGSPVIKRKTPPPLPPGCSSIRSCGNASHADQLDFPKPLSSFPHNVVANSARCDEEKAVPSPTLMQRVAAATAPLDLCQVFEVSTESIFTGEVMKKRFSRDLLAKDRFVWIVPRTKSIHWAKNAKDRLDNHKVKFFLLDKNSPYVNTSAMLSTATSCKEDGQSGSSSATAGPSPAQSSMPSPTSPVQPSLFTQLARGDRSKEARASLVASDEEDFGPCSSPVDTVQAASHLSDGSQLGSPNLEAISRDGTPRLPARADGEMVGIIHSAVINHLTIRIKTESGDYLSLTINSKGNSVQRAKDWFNVIKILTKDI